MITLQERVHGCQPPSSWSPGKLHRILRVRKGNKNIGMQEDNLLSLSYGRVVEKDIESTEGLLPESFETYQIVDRGNIVMRLTDLQNDKRSLRQGLVKQRGIITSAYDALEVGKGHDPRFWAYALLALDLAKYYYSLGGGVRQSIKFADFPNEWVAVPDLAAQKHIADFLDREIAWIDQLVEKKQRFLDVLRQKRSGAITAVVTKGVNPTAPMEDSGIEWLGDMPAHWEKNFKLAFAAAPMRNAVVNGPFGSDLLTAELTEEGVPVIYSGDVHEGPFVKRSKWHVTEEKARQLAFCTVLPGDLLVAKVGDPPGTTAVYPQNAPPAIVTQDVIRIRPDERRVSANYLSYMLNSTFGKAIIKEITVESTRGRFPLSRLRGVRFPLPPLEEQRELVSIMNVIQEQTDRIVVPIERSIDRLRQFRSSLITAAVTGQVDAEHWGKSGDTDRQLEAIEKGLHVG